MEERRKKLVLENSNAIIHLEVVKNEENGGEFIFSFSSCLVIEEKKNTYQKLKVET